jgi:hypothetical protein
MPVSDCPLEERIPIRAGLGHTGYAAPKMRRGTSESRRGTRRNAMRCCGRAVVAAIVLAAACGLATAAEGERIVVTQTYQKSLRGKIGEFPVLILRGTHRERGRAHGYLGAKEIVRTADAMATAINMAGKVRKKAISWEGAAGMTGRFRYPERFTQELEGMLEGVEEALPNANDRTLKATGKPLTMADLRILQCGDVLELMMCSQFSAWGGMTEDGATIIGRNWDYPPFFPFDTYCIFAVSPAEKGLAKTIDALWFGMLGAGFACINGEGVYLSADDGGEEDMTKTRDPVPAALAVRMAAESATAADPLASVRENIFGKSALHILYHIVAPAEKAGGSPRAWIFEYLPGSGRSFEHQLRTPTASLPQTLFVTNTPMIGRKDSESGCERYDRLLARLSSKDGSARLDFDSARALMDSVSRNEPGVTTQYSGVAYPQKKEIHIAVAVTPGRSATKERYTRVRWDDVWSARPQDVGKLNRQVPPRGAAARKGLAKPGGNSTARLQ